MIEIYKEAPFNTFHFKGTLTDSEIHDVIFNATPHEREMIFSLMRHANETMNMSDILIFFANLFRVGEDIAKRKNPN
jgi:hypothetical protein